MVSLGNIVCVLTITENQKSSISISFQTRRALINSRHKWLLTIHSQLLWHHLLYSQLKSGISLYLPLNGKLSLMSAFMKHGYMAVLKVTKLMPFWFSTNGCLLSSKSSLHLSHLIASSTSGLEGLCMVPAAVDLALAVEVDEIHQEFVAHTAGEAAGVP